MCRVGDEALLRFDRSVESREQPVERAYERAHLLRLVLLRHRAEVARRTCRDLVAKAVQGPQSLTDAEPEKCHGGKRYPQLGHPRSDQEPQHEIGSVYQPFAALAR